MAAKSKTSVLVLPIDNLLFEGAAQSEFRIDRVTLYPIQRAKKLRKLFGIDLWKDHPIRSGEFFTERSTALAAMPVSGELAAEDLPLGIMLDEIDLLHSLQLPLHPDNRDVLRFWPSGESWWRVRRLGVLRSVDPHTLQTTHLDSPQPFILYRSGAKNRVRHHRQTILRAIRPSGGFSPEMRARLRRGLVALGRSLSAMRLPEQLLQAVICWEALLMNEQEKITVEMPVRMKALLKWEIKWRKEQFDQIVTDTYHKRCQFVHKGDESSISLRDVRLAQELGYNLVLTIARHANLFFKHGDLKAFVDRAVALQTLGSKKRTKPKSFNYRWVYGGSEMPFPKNAS